MEENYSDFRLSNSIVYHKKYCKNNSAFLRGRERIIFKRNIILSENFETLYQNLRIYVNYGAGVLSCGAIVASCLVLRPIHSKRKRQRK